VVSLLQAIVGGLLGEARRLELVGRNHAELASGQRGALDDGGLLLGRSGRSIAGEVEGEQGRDEARLLDGNHDNERVE
jgi:hypothetical protein